MQALNLNKPLNNHLHVQLLITVKIMTFRYCPLSFNKHHFDNKVFTVKKSVALSNKLPKQSKDVMYNSICALFHTVVKFQC